MSNPCRTCSDKGFYTQVTVTGGLTVRRCKLRCQKAAGLVVENPEGVKDDG